MRKIRLTVFCSFFILSCFSQTSTKKDSLRLIYDVLNYDNAFPIIQKISATQVSPDASKVVLITPEKGYFINTQLKRIIKITKNPLRELDTLANNYVEPERNELKIDWKKKIIEYEPKNSREEQDLFLTAVEFDDSDKKELYGYILKANNDFAFAQNSNYKDILGFNKKKSIVDTDYKETIIYLNNTASKGYIFDSKFNLTGVCNYTYYELETISNALSYITLNANSRYIISIGVKNKDLRIIDLNNLKVKSSLVNFKLNNILVISKPEDIFNLSDSIVNNRKTVEHYIDSSMNNYNLKPYNINNDYDFITNYHQIFKTINDNDDYYVKPSVAGLKNDSLLLFKNKTDKTTIDAILQNMHNEFFEDSSEDYYTFLEDEEDLISSASYLMYYGIRLPSKRRFGLSSIYNYYTHFEEKNNVLELTSLSLLDQLHNNNTFSFSRNKISYKINIKRFIDDSENTTFPFHFTYNKWRYFSDSLFILKKPTPNLSTTIERTFLDSESEIIKFEYSNQENVKTTITQVEADTKNLYLNINNHYGTGQLKLPKDLNTYWYKKKNRAIDVVRHYKEENNLKSNGELYKHYKKMQESNSIIKVSLNESTLSKAIPRYILIDFWNSNFNAFDVPVIGFSKNNRYMLWNSGNSISYNTKALYLVDLKKKEVVKRFPFDYSKKIHYPSFHKNYSVLLMPLSENHFEVFDLVKQEKLADYYYYSEHDWYVVTPEGLFDKSSNSKDNLYFVYGDEEIFELDQFKKEYKVNDLLNILLGKIDKPLPKSLNLQNEIKKLPPIIDYEIVDNSSLSGTITKREGGINNVFFTIAGSDKKAIPLNFNNQDVSNFTISLDEFNDSYVTDNLIAVRATNSSNTISSSGPIINYKYDPSFEKIKIETSTTTPYNPEAKLYALFVGIENYKDRKLQYAEEDATDMETCVDLINKKLYKNNPYIKSLINNQATKDNILQEFNFIKKNARAQDVILLYFSGHGITGEALEDKVPGNNNFYFITENFNYVNKDYFSELDIDDQYNSNEAISSTELKRFLSGVNMNAQKKILIMDACYSGKLVEENSMDFVKSDGGKLTAAQEKALRDLNTKTGTVVMTASRSNEKAYEDDLYQHSFLTWGLLKALKEKDFTDNNVNIGAWLSYAKHIVEHQISEIQIQKPSIDFNKDFDFTIGSVRDNVLGDFVLPSPLPIMNNAEISGDGNSFNSTQIAKNIQKKLNSLLSEHTFPNNASERVFTFRNAEYKTSGYRISGSIASNQNYIQLKYWLVKDGKEMILNKDSCNPDSKAPPQYCINFDRDNLDSEITIFIKDIINHIKINLHNEN